MAEVTAGLQQGLQHQPAGRGAHAVLLPLRRCRAALERLASEQIVDVWTPLRTPDGGEGGDEGGGVPLIEAVLSRAMKHPHIVSAARCLHALLWPSARGFMPRKECSHLPLSAAPPRAGANARLGRERGRC